MRWFHFRPTFDWPLEETRDVAIERLDQQFSQRKQRERFAMYGEYGELHLPPEQHRLWSPHLSFYVMPREQRSVIHGRFAPRVDVWTSVWIAYLMMVFSAFFGAMLAYSQWTLGESVWGLIIVGVSLSTILALYLVAHIGQQWSADQMEFLRTQLEEMVTSAELHVSSCDHASGKAD
jgi:hypothetical protein